MEPDTLSVHFKNYACQAGVLLYLVVLHVLKHLNGHHPVKLLLGIKFDNIFCDDSLHQRTARKKGSTTKVKVMKRKDCWVCMRTLDTAKLITNLSHA